MSEEDLELLITLDDPWNAQECDNFYNHQVEQEAEEWKGTFRMVTAPGSNNWPAGFGRRVADPSSAVGLRVNTAQ